MAVYNYTPTTFDGVDITASPFNRVWFMARLGPVGNARSVRPVEADVIGLGPQDVRAQPRASVWRLHVELTGDTVANEKTLKETFSEERGLVFLIANDGDAAAWRVQCRVIGMQRVPGNTKYWLVDLRIPRPLWEENAATSDANVGQSGDSIADTLTNNGNRKSYPTITLKGDGLKSEDPAETFVKFVRGYCCNRSPLPWSDLPIDITDQAGGTAGIDMSTSLIRDTGTAGTLNGSITAGATTATLNGGHGFSDGPQFFFIDAEGGNTKEQVYGALATNAISGMIRGLGGNVASAHGNSAAVNKSLIMEDGSDMRAFVNGREVERFLGGVNSTAMRIWINVTMPPRVKLTCVNAGTASVPANGGEIEFEEGVEGLPESGVLWSTSGATEAGRELISYSGRDIAGRKVTGIQRNAWYGAGAASYDIGDSFYYVSILFGFGYSRGVGTGFSNGISAPPDPIDRRPAIQLKSSTNILWRYGDQADDSNTIFHDKARPNRTAQFRPDFTVLSEENNDAEPLLLDDSSTKAAWKDSVPAAGKLSVGRLTLALPQGIEAVASAITYDVQKRREFRMRILGSDLGGLEIELADQYDTDEASSTGQTITPTATIHNLVLSAVRASVTGNADDALSNFLAMDAATHFLSQKIVIDRDTLIAAILMNLEKTAGASFTARITIKDDSGSTPDAGRTLWRSAGVSTATISESSAWEQFVDPAGISVELFLPAGTFWLEINFISYSSGTLRVRTAAPTSKNSESYSDITAGVGYNASSILLFRAIHSGAGPIQSEAQLLNQGVAATFDKLILALNDASGDITVPKTDRDNDFDGDNYFYDGVLTNSTTSDTIAISVIAGLGWSLVIDTEKKTVKLTDGNTVLNLPIGITPSNLAEWFPLNIGANSVTWAEPDMTDTDLTFSHRGKKV